MSQPYYNRVNIILNYLQGFASGIYLLLAGLGFLVYATVSEKSYFIFAAYCFFSFWTIIFNRGIWDAINPASNKFFAADFFVPVFFLCRFLELYLVKVSFETRKKYPIVNRLIFVMLSLYALFGLSNYIDLIKSVVWPFLPQILVIGAVLIVGIMIYFIKMRHKWAVEFFLAWTVGLTSYFIWGFYHLLRGQEHWLLGYAPLFIRPIQFFLLSYIVLLNWKDMTIELGVVRASAREGNLVKALLRTLSHDLSNTTHVIQMSADLLKNTEERL